MTAPKSRRILFIINSLVGGGAERVMATLLGHSAEEGRAYDIHLALLDEEKTAYAVPEWVTVHRLDCGFGLVKSILRVSALVKRLNPAITLSFLTRANIANVIACRLHGTIAVISERVDTSVHLGDKIGGRIKKALVRLSYNRAHRIIAVSAGVAGDLQRNFGVSPDKIVVIANPVDARTIRQRGQETPAIDLPRPFTAAVGRLVENKNFALLIEAFAQSGAPGHLVVLGEGPLRPALMEQARRLGIADRVHLPGFSANPFAITRNAEQFVLPSNAEGFPNGLVEAMALGLPVIATNCPSGPAEILAGQPREAVTEYTEAEYGILVRPNSVPDMVAALRAMQDPELNRRYRARAVERADAYSPAEAKDRYWAVLMAEIQRAALPGAAISGSR
jgi:N-acetylgalactosamine-N,N'-diacetylbacillosaminyl-diphospho-undecaprenol 4-alpha-N-acetylgalactosaminyltransferase